MSTPRRDGSLFRSEPAIPRPAADQQPVALLYGTGHRIVHGNPAFIAEFGPMAVGLPAREALVGLPPRVFEVVDLVLTGGRPLAPWVEVAGERRRLSFKPRPATENDEI